MYKFIFETNWERIFTELKEFPNSNQRKTCYNRKFLGKTGLINETMPGIFASIKPIKLESKYSPSETFANIPNTIITPYGAFTKDNFRYYMKLFLETGMSVFGDVKKEPFLNPLTPLILAAHKILNNINYEEWDFEDPKIKFMMGYQLGELIQHKNTDFSETDKLQVRKEVLTIKKTKNEKLATAYPTRKNIPSLGMKSTSMLAIILSQVWLANIMYRKENTMVLDPNNWDNIPEPLDILLVEDPIIKKLENREEYPF